MSKTSPSGTWSNWAGNQTCAPTAVEHPASADELAAVVKAASAAGETFKVVGAGHSFTDIACTEGRQIQLDRYGAVLDVDTRTRQVKVESGISIADLNAQLDSHGLALANLGDIAYQTISGAVATATHGTGVKLGGIATQIRALDVITGDGSTISCSADEEAEVFESARVTLGALGVLSNLTLQCEPAFNLRAIEEPQRVDSVLERIDALVDGHDHFEFFWVPHTGWALTKTNDRTDDPVGGRARWQEIRDKVLLENVAFGIACRVGRWRPSLIPKLAKAVPSSGRTEYVEKSWKVFASPRWVHFYEMEYSIPRAALPDALNEVRRYVDSSGLHISFPVEVRFTAGDDIPLSTAYGEERAYIAVHVYRGMPYEQYFRAVEAIMNEHGGRPHWGKMHYQSAETLNGRYPQWDQFQKVRDRLDPERRFANAYTRRVLGD